MIATFLTRTNVRVHPATTSDVLKVTTAGDTATVLNSQPFLSGGYAWYYLRHADGVIGYSARQTLDGVELFNLDGIAPELEALSEVELLALMVVAEAGNQPLAGRVAVAMVAMERVKLRPRYGSGLRGVLLKPYQFSTFNGDHWRRFVDYVPAYTALAELAVGRFLNSPVAGSTHYLRYDVLPEPKWTEAQFSVYVGRVQDHLFFREL